MSLQLSEDQIHERQKPVAFDRLLPFLLLGYMLFGRPFAWLHIPGTPLFIGELILATGLAGALRAVTWRPVWTRSSIPLVLLAYVAWGLARSIPGILEDPVIALRDAVLWGYALVAWAVLGVVAQRPGTLVYWFQKYLRVMPVAVVWIPITVVLGAREFGTVPDSNVSLTAFDNGMMQIQLLMILSFLWLVWDPKRAADLRWRSMVSGMAVVGLLVLATRNRGGFVGVMVGLFLVLMFNQARTRLIVTTARVLLVLAVVVIVVDPRIDVGEREISVSQLSDNVASLVTLQGDESLGGNISWRLEHWSSIWKGVNSDVPLAGHGFGPNIAEIYHIPQTDIGLRNAHNSHLTLLARSGWIGFILWVVLWWAWFAEVNRSRRRFGDTGFPRLSGLAGWAMAAMAGFHIEAVFNPSIEGPQTAFWVWSIFGLGMYLAAVSRWRRYAKAGDSLPAWQSEIEALESGMDRLTRRKSGQRATPRVMPGRGRR